MPIHFSASFVPSTIALIEHRSSIRPITAVGVPIIVLPAFVVTDE
jgi:hypothetical protein